MQMTTHYLQKSIEYTGRELRPHWTYEQTGEFGTALVAFRGPCMVPTNALVDLEDAAAGSEIRAREMLHFIGEFFGETLELTVVRQRLFAAVFAETLRRFLPDATASKIMREGDDIYLVENKARRKLTVSIVTASAVSTLLHFGVNINAEGAPVAAAGLNEFSLDIGALVEEVFCVWKSELRTQEIARSKVLPR